MIVFKCVSLYITRFIMFIWLKGLGYYVYVLIVFIKKELNLTCELTVIRLLVYDDGDYVFT